MLLDLILPDGEVCLWEMLFFTVLSSNLFFLAFFLSGNTELDIVVEAANKEMITLKDADLNKLLAKYTSNGKAISEGFRFKCTIPIRKILTDSVKDLKNEKNIPEKIMLQVVMTKEKVDFIFPEDFKSDLINIAIALTPKLSEKALEKVPSAFNKTVNLS